MHLFSLGILALLVAGGWARQPFRVAPISSSVSGETQTITTNCTFQSKRVWVICSDARFLSDGKSLSFQAKDTVIAKAKDPVPMSISETWKGGYFYYFDIPKTTECFRIDSIKDSNTIAYKTDWVCDIKTSLVYEITSDVSAGIRSRTTDVEDKRHPDAKILGLLLSSYITFDPSYENGYGGYAELQTAWISKYIGNYGSIEGPDLANTFIYDYTEEEYQNRYTDGKKTRVLSVADKVTELSNAYASKKASAPLVSKRDKWISILALFVSSQIAGGLLTLVIVIDKKHGKKAAKQS